MYCNLDIRNLIFLLNKNFSNWAPIIGAFILINYFKDLRINWENPSTSRFVKGTKVALVTHGWYDGWYEEGLLGQARNAFLANTDYNYIGLGQDYILRIILLFAISLLN